jgi:hypothetical protein
VRPLRPSRASRLPRSAAAALAAFAVALVTALALAGPASALDAGSITRSTGNVEATVSWDKAELGVSNPHLKITRDGQVAFDAEITDVCPSGCFLVADDPQYPGSSILHLADLDNDGEVEVIVDTYSGGAHCCTVARIYAYRSDEGVFTRSISQYWGNSGYSVADLNGDQKQEMSGADDSFAYAFSSYASSAFPPKVMAYTRDPVTGKGTVKDVTRRFPKLIRADARRRLRDIRAATPDPTYESQGYVAAYVADQFLLGRGSVGLREIRRARSKRLVSKGFGARLLRFLHKVGYR